MSDFSGVLLLVAFVLGSPEFNFSIALCKLSTLASLPLVGILNSLGSVWNIRLFIYNVPNYHNSAKYIWRFNKVIGLFYFIYRVVII